MRTKILTAIVLAAFASLLIAARFTDSSLYPRITAITHTNLFPVWTNTSYETWEVGMINASNLLDSMITFGNWPAIGAGDVTTAQLLTASNLLRTDFIANDTTTSNGLVTLETTRNAAVSNSLVTLSSNNVRVAAGTGGITVSGSGSGGVMTWTINDDDAGAGDTNFVVTTTDHAFITNLTVTGSSPGTITLSNTTGSAFVKLQMSDAGTSKTNAISFSTTALGEVVGFHDANGTLTNRTTSGTGSLVAQTNATVSALAMYDGASVEGNFEVIGGGSLNVDALISSKVLAIDSTNETSRFTFDIPNGLGTNRFHLNVPTNTIAVDQVLKVHSVTHTASGTDVTLTNAVGGGASGPTTNAPPYTVPITGTNFVIDWLALGPTNDIVLTNYAAAGILNTNIIPGKVIRARIDQGSQGFQTIVPNTNYFGPNWRYTAVQTGITQSTNGGYEDFIVLYGSRTNAVLSGQNWGAAP